MTARYLVLALRDESTGEKPLGQSGLDVLHHDEGISTHDDDRQPRRNAKGGSAERPASQNANVADQRHRNRYIGISVASQYAEDQHGR